jgi:hypothetical protein
MADRLQAAGLSELLQKHGSAKRPERTPVHPRPPTASNSEVAAVGKLSEALEAVEDARGHLYAFHRLSGRADLLLQEAVQELRDSGHQDLADQLATLLVGRDVIDGKWTFQLVESYDASYWAVFREAERAVRVAVVEGAPHTLEAEMRKREQDG